MSVPLHSPFPRTTQAAEGLPRRRWTVDEIEVAIRAGIFAGDERFELIGGELVAMAAKGIRHELLRNELTFRWARLCPAHMKVASETPLRLGADMAPQPDIIVHPAAIRSPVVDGPSALLVVEIADSSLSYDLATKLAIYASYGVREYWVIDAWALKTRVHLQPAATGYGRVEEYTAEAVLAPTLAPELSLSLADLDVE